MNWASALAGVLVLWAGTAWGATLTWKANQEPDLAGYRVYQCSLQPCTKSSGNASLLVTLGTGTSFNIGTPAVTQYYFITAYDFANKESSRSNVVTFTPVGSPPPPPASVALITFDAASSAEGTTSTTHNATIDEDANIAIVCLSMRENDGGVQSATGVTVGGEAATFLVASSNPTDNVHRVEIWYKLAPATGTPQVIATAHASTDSLITGVMSFKGVAQTSTFNTAKTASGAPNANADVDNLASAVGEVGVYCGEAAGASGITTVSADGGAPISTSTKRYKDKHSNGRAVGFGFTEVGAVTSINMRVNLSASVNWAAAAVSLRPAH
jgi:hypothetical protein